MKKAVLACGLAFLALSLSVSSASAGQELRISNIGPFGFTAETLHGWKFGSGWSCHGRALKNDGTRTYTSIRPVTRFSSSRIRFGYRTPRAGKPIYLTCRGIHKRVTRHQWRNYSSTRSGTETSSRSRQGPCYLDGFYGELQLDCWGGRYAIAHYHFELPGDARSVDTGASGYLGCCSQGRVSKDWSRSGNDWTYTVTVTGWRAYTVRRVHMDYSRRITVHPVIHSVGRGKARR